MNQPKEQDKATPELPNQLQARSDWAIDSNKQFVADTGGSSCSYAFKVALRDALVNRYNSHHALVEALEAMLATNEGHFSESLSAVDQARAALALAKP